MFDLDFPIKIHLNRSKPCTLFTRVHHSWRSSTNFRSSWLYPRTIQLPVTELGVCWGAEQKRKEETEKGPWKQWNLWKDWAPFSLNCQWNVGYIVIQHPKRIKEILYDEFVSLRDCHSPTDSVCGCLWVWKIFWTIQLFIVIHLFLWLLVTFQVANLMPFLLPLMITKFWLLFFPVHPYQRDTLSWPSAYRTGWRKRTQIWLSLDAKASGAFLIVTVVDMGGR